jgi:prepilin-type N-terminal cleavage/methylation domain-containing protein
VTIQHQPRAFTLIELLVVIGVIALLMAILLPCLQRARRQAKAMVCQAHLKQWAHILAIYTDENEGYFPYGDSVASVWLFRGPMPLEEGDSMIRPFTQPVSTDGIRCCPMAVREPVDTGSTTIGLGCGPKGEFFEVTWAHATKRSEVWKTIRPAPSFVASYGFNGWLLENTNIRPIGLIHGRRELPRATNVFSVRGRSAVPVLLDCLEPDELVDNGNSPPEKEGVVGGPRRSENIALFCVNRHDGYLRGLFLDWSVRKVGIKELWTLKWHRDFNTRGQWTKAAGVQPEDWPEWMRNFKDY